MQKYIQFFSFCILLLCGLNTVSAQENSASSEPISVSVQLNWKPQFEFAGFYAAIQQGYYHDAGLKVTLKPWFKGVEVTEEVVAKRADFAIDYSFSIIDAIKGAPIKLVMATFQYSPISLLSHEPIRDLTMLAGKTVMHDGDLQIKALIKQVNDRVAEPVIELPASGNLQDFIDQKVDFYSIYETNEPYLLRQKGVPFYVVDPKSYGIHSYSDLLVTHQDLATQEPQLVSAMRAATLKGWQYALQHPQKIVDYILQNYPVTKDREALLAEAKAMVGFVKPSNAEIGAISDVKVSAIALEAENLGFITAEQRAAFDVKSLIFQNTELNLTAAERQYFQQHPVITVGIDEHWEPFEFVDSSGQWKGISADYFNLLSQRLGVKFVPSKGKTWQEVIEAARNHEIKLLSCAVATPERKQFLTFTKPYLSFPLVFVAEQDVNFVEDFRHFNGETLAIPKGYWTLEWIRSNYPKINILPVDTVQEGLEAVLVGKAKAFSGNLASINFAIKRYGLQGLHVVGDSGVKFDLSVGVSKQEPVLAGIMQKALQSIDSEHRDRIYSKWIQLEVVQKTDNRTFLIVVVSGLLAIAILGLIARIFYRQKQKQAQYIKRINELTYATYTNYDTHKIEWVSDSFLALAGCTREQILGQKHERLLHPDEGSDLISVIKATLAKGLPFTGEVKSLGCDGRELWVEITIVPDFKGSKLVGAWSTRVDITDKKRLKEMAIKDALTGTYNRHLFNEMFEPLLLKANRNKTSFSIVMFDIDLFKSINDQYGHQKGDEVLVEFTNLAKQYFGRGNDILFRVGGEEFILICDFESHEALQSYLEKFREAVEALNIVNEQSPYGVMTVSVGGVFYCQVSELDGSKVYSLVDNLLYRAKQQGRNRVISEMR